MNTNTLIMATVLAAAGVITAAAQTQRELAPDEQQAPATTLGFSDVVNEAESSLSVSLVTTYMWRGMEKSNVSILPCGRLEWRGAYAQLQAATGFERDDAKEINLTVGYRHRLSDRLKLNASLTDYWTSGKSAEDHDVYFEWNPERNAHQLELNVGVDFRWVSLQAYTMIWGNDYRYDKLADAQNRLNGTRAFSTFIEARVPFTWQGLEWELAAGVSPFKSANTMSVTLENDDFSVVHKNYFYADKPALILASARVTKHLNIGSVKMPVFAELHTNPYMKRANVLVGVSVTPF